jgi:hypothetical protein
VSLHPQWCASEYIIIQHVVYYHAFPSLEVKFGLLKIGTENSTFYYEVRIVPVKCQSPPLNSDIRVWIGIRKKSDYFALQ